MATVEHWGTIMADRRAQLGWIQKNRARVHREARAGEVVGRFAAQWLEGGSSLAWIHDVIHRTTDENFQRCCSVMAFDAGCVTVGVEDASLVGWMDRQWRRRLLAAFGDARQGRQVTDIRFIYSG